jgi:hypothetical protein
MKTIHGYTLEIETLNNGLLIESFATLTAPTGEICTYGKGEFIPAVIWSDFTESTGSDLTDEQCAEINSAVAEFVAANL